MVAILTGIFGVAHLNLAEDVFRKRSFAPCRHGRFMESRKIFGLDHAATRNLALDVVRREKVFRDKEAEIVHMIERQGSDEMVFAEQEIADDRLRMMFVCCHPSIPPEAQVALALKTLCGFGPMEIAQAFLTTEAAIAKRLTRAKQKIREAQIRFEIPAGEELAQRFDGVLQSLYLLFNEGYKASTGERLVREEICQEAIRLTNLLVEHPVCNRPKAHALLALMLLNAARAALQDRCRSNLLRLQEQDRANWDRG
jgi:RNA polymerase sigma-70 factor (ECF subfamily)